ncbi:hypothetical protein EYF80_034216 [Liparis tanakae]|uniref:Uncharacterized protein n=1 Tax=Liparis tanakae TaxID=230148 RepID=A0A4Z2GPG3_9TELE|nr:hypothetical protein EYF80_034216 [Liparis tanakae]
MCLPALHRLLMGVTARIVGSVKSRISGQEEQGTVELLKPLIDPVASQSTAVTLIHLVTSLISTEKEIWNNVYQQARGGRPLEESVENRVNRIVAQPKALTITRPASPPAVMSSCPYPTYLFGYISKML